MSMVNFEEALDVAIAAAHDAGKILRDRFARHCAESGDADLDVRSKGSPRELVTEVDALAQRAIVDRILQTYPDHRFIGEEEGAADLGNPHSPFAWIIDPLDGTMNFVRRKSGIGTLIALQENGETKLGVMLLPLHGQLFTGIRGQGAFLNGAPITLRHTIGIADSILCTNGSKRARPCKGGALHISLPVCASLQNYGNAAEEMGEILLGHNDGVFYEGVGLWDVAAGCLLIEEAGGKSRTELINERNPWAGVNCIASTKEIFEELSEFMFKQ